jgi:hypothetical protein
MRAKNDDVDVPLASAFAFASLTALCTISTPTTCAHRLAIESPSDPVPVQARWLVPKEAMSTASHAPQHTSNSTVLSSG